MGSRTITNQFGEVTIETGWRRWNGLFLTTALGLVSCLFLIQSRAFGEADHDSPGGESGGGPARYRPQASGPGESSSDGCDVSPSSLVSFANGDRYDFKSMVRFLTSTACRSNSSSIRASALKSGIDFSSAYPYRLNMFLPQTNADGFGNSSRRPGSLTNDDTLQQVDNSLASSIPPLLREYPLTSKDGLPILGQLALLSPKAAKSALGTMIEQELITGSALLNTGSERDQLAIAREISSNVLRLGANQPAMITELSDTIEEKAALAQWDSLSKVVPTLATIATNEASLVSTFNASAAALNRGVQRGKNSYSEESRAGLISSIVLSLKATLASNGALDPGAADLNEALAGLDRGIPLTADLLRRLWRDAIRVLVNSNSQPALAAAVAISLTPEMSYLGSEDIRRLIAAARNYPRIAISIQTNFLLAFDKQWADLQDGRLKPAVFNRLKRQYFDPIVTDVLSFEPAVIDPFWLRQALHYELVKDADIEKRFPRLVLALLERRDEAIRSLAQSNTVEAQVNAMTENFAVLWTLSNVHLPALLKWVKKYDQ